MCIGSNSVNQAQDLISVTKFEDFPNSLIPNVNTGQQLMINLIISHDIICKNKFAWKMMHFCVPLICKLCQAIACLEICRGDRGINKCKRLQQKCYFHVVMFPAFILRR